MTWISGPCSAESGAAYIITDTCPEVVRIGDDEVRADEQERATEDRISVFTEVACVNPGLVSTLNALEGQLKTGPLPSAPVLRAYGQYIVRLGAAVVSYAEDYR